MKSNARLIQKMMITHVAEVLVRRVKYVTASYSIP